MTINVSYSDIGKLASFQLIPATIITEDFTNCTIMGIIMASVDNASNLPQIHQEVYPMLPADTPDDYMAYPYLQVRLANGTVTMVGIPWIKEESFVTKASLSIQFTVNDCNLTDRENILKILSVNGYNAVGAKVIGN